jgi:spore photoproduct lyase
MYDGRLTLNVQVMEEIKKRPDCKILFVTKSCNINNLLKIDNKQQAIVSFSVNATPVADRWEKGAPKVKARLNAAKKLSEAGFEVRLRIDPMVPVDGWTEAYSELIDDIFERLTPERITIGSLRGLQSTINNSPDRSWTEYLDEKSNWGRKISLNKRLEMYQLIITKLREEHQFERVALCKETVEMWQALGLDYSKIRCNCTL